MVQCCVINCKGRADKEAGLRLFCVPTALKNQCSKSILLSERRRAFWIERINRNIKDEDVKPQTRVCSRHFVTGKAAGLFDYMNPDWAPTLSMGYDQSHLDAMIKRQQLSLSQDMGRLESSLQSLLQSASPSQLQPATRSSSIKRVSDSEPLKSISRGEVKIYETLVCEPSISDLPVCEQSIKNEINQDCEDMPEENFSDQLEDCFEQDDDMSPGRTGMFEVVVCDKIKAEITDEEEVHENLSECEQNIDNLKSQVEILQEHNSTLMNTVANLILHEDTLRNDDAKVSYYTGLPTFTLLMHVFELVGTNVTDSPLYVLPKFQQLLIVLMRLRLNLQEQDLAYRFNVSVSTVRRIFCRWLTAMSVSLEQCFIFPDRESLVKSMPVSFKREWGNSIAVIIDCFEVPTDRSSSRTRSVVGLPQYKFHNSVKFLIGMTSQGTIAYVSPAYGDHSSDKFIVEDCGILDYLLPNDVVIGDRAFNVTDNVSCTGARLVVPAEGKPQLCYNDAVLTQQIGNVKNHVERLLGLVRNKYIILKSVIPVEYLNRRDGDEYAFIDHIVRVCCALTNLCPPIVPLE